MSTCPQCRQRGAKLNGLGAFSCAEVAVAAVPGVVGAGVRHRRFRWAWRTVDHVADHHELLESFLPNRATRALPSDSSLSTTVAYTR